MRERKEEQSLVVDYTDKSAWLALGNLGLLEISVASLHRKPIHGMEETNWNSDVAW